MESRPTGLEDPLESDLMPGLPPCYFPSMRRLCLCLAFLGLTALPARPAPAPVAVAKVIKALPQFLDQHGQTALSPSLFERDAYQAWLRKHPSERTGLRLAVQWKARGVDWSKLKLRAELRGVLGNSLHNTTLELPVNKKSHFSQWTGFQIDGEDFKQFGQLVAWRVTLWEGDQPIASQQSFLWSPVGQEK